ncbi:MULTISPECIES: type I-F CRISPR-associated protein Csy2 [unclassified Shewanella]|uniref:type I-F CRISPR-associated protein Csy2 n=1 Tax=unclassified Shewanella TaxID=196818 RepID=UPI0020046956|nr:MULTISPECIES: type I-F CRISPR-associated protein Csy2 [unclassified Shewanella]MCK7633010.1 type I-F CRISPR-associated protein Csy2 [Shewanella sp. JNE17]MCK7648391.1 type I-F CRISPR-associated protein Csy2 [Shewanella sp. JNE8]MCK7656485.1 type I-F CRISPR-associated protein Csy2 [Shewanella sp. JNE4-2]UPO32976.1 type I-F CRISPR-associated protein Csy2 [Shewanella sp. JNE2]
MIGEVKKLLIIPHIKVHNANALSSPFTIGFPAMTAWLGGVHALQRHVNAQDIPVNFLATGVVSHDVNLQTYKGDNDYVHSIVGTGNPLDKTGARSAFIEEARCHLEISLVIELNGITIDEHEHLLSAVTQLLHAKMKLAGGDIKSFQPPFCINNSEGDDKDLRKLQRHLMPGYVLIERRDLMQAAMAEGVDALNALIDYLAVHHSCDQDEEGNIEWRSYRKTLENKPAGWVVPIATGYHALSELSDAKNQRDPNTSHRFAESLVTLGEFKMPHRLHSVEQMLWRYHIDGDLYLCQQKHSESPKSASSGLTSIESEF